MADTLDPEQGGTVESAGQEQPKDAQVPPEDKDLIDEIVENIALVNSIEGKQRRMEEDALIFEGEDQWTVEARDSRLEHTDDVTGQKVPARPAMTVNLVEQPIQRIVSEARQARLSLTVQPKAGLANTKMAGYFKGIIRSIQAESGAGEIRLWSLEQTAKCGRHAYIIDTEYANDGDFDLDIVYRRVLDGLSFYWDPYAVYADKRDAMWSAEATWISEEARKRNWDKPIIPSAGAFETPDHPWFAVDEQKNKRSVRIVTYWKVHLTTTKLAYHPDHGTMPLEKLPPDAQQHVLAKAPGTRLREPETRTVMRYVADGTQILEKHHVEGRYLPTIPTIGKEYNVKGKRSWKGAVTNAMDLNRGYNVTISSATETVGSMPRAPYIMLAGQDTGFEDMWDDSPIRAYTRLYYNAVDVDGKPGPAPQRQQLEPEIQGALLLARNFKDDLAYMMGAVTGTSGGINPYDRSGKAIDLMQRQGSAGSSNYLDNLGTISMPQEGRVLINKIPKVYDRRGRIVGCMGEENDDEKAIMIKMPFVHDEDGNPIPVPCPMCQGTQRVKGPKRHMLDVFPPMVQCPACPDGYATEETMPAEYNDQPVEYVDLSKGEFKVTVAIGRNFQTKQEEAMASMTQLATSAPDLVPVYADLWVRAMGFSGANEIADRIKRHNPAAQDDADTKKVPPEFQAKFMQLQQEHQLAMQELQKATELLKTKGIEAQNAQLLQGMKDEAAQALEHLKQQGAFLEASYEHKATQQQETLRGNLEQMRLESEQKHEVLLQLLKELGAKEIERHKASLHAEAAAQAEKELPGAE